MEAGESWRRLLSSLLGNGSGAPAIDDCLETLIDILGADRGLIFVADPDGVPFALNARGHRRSLTQVEREEVSRSIIQRAMSQRHQILWQANDNAPSGSMMRWGIQAALAAPLMTAADNQHPAKVLGAIYVDYRGPGGPAGVEELSFLDQSAPLLAAALQQALRVQVANERLRRLEAVAAPSPHNDRIGLDEIIVGQGIAGLRDEILSVVHGRSPVLILGESGTGKTVLAEALGVARGKGPVVRAVLGMSDDHNTIVSELFGHEKGSFSGSLTRRTGLVELAHEGTLIFDELLNLPNHAQKLLLDFAQFGTYRPLGYDKREPKRASVRLIACTNGKIDDALASEALRSDLYYRLAGARLTLPPLRERRADIPSIAARFLARAFPGQSWTVSEEVVSSLTSIGLSWPGNVRQLESELRRAVERAEAAGAADHRLVREHVWPRRLGLEGASSSDVGAPSDLGEAWKQLHERRDLLDDTERRIIERALRNRHDIVAHAAKDLGTSRTGLLSRIQTLGVEREPAPLLDRQDSSVES